jgi:hypothetical protein
MALSGILIGAADVRPKWLQVGVHLIAVDTLVQTSTGGWAPSSAQTQTHWQACRVRNFTCRVPQH